MMVSPTCVRTSPSTAAGRGLELSALGDGVTAIGQPTLEPQHTLVTDQ
jgi:hypothetical protein